MEYKAEYFFLDDTNILYGREVQSKVGNRMGYWKLRSRDNAEHQIQVNKKSINLYNRIIKDEKLSLLCGTRPFPVGDPRRWSWEGIDGPKKATIEVVRGLKIIPFLRNLSIHNKLDHNKFPYSRTRAF